jgi:hypothetical protein
VKIFVCLTSTESRISSAPSSTGDTDTRGPAIVQAKQHRIGLLLPGIRANPLRSVKLFIINTQPREHENQP